MNIILYFILLIIAIYIIARIPAKALLKIVAVCGVIYLSIGLYGLYKINKSSAQTPESLVPNIGCQNAQYRTAEGGC